MLVITPTWSKFMTIKNTSVMNKEKRDPITPTWSKNQLLVGDNTNME